MKQALLISCFNWYKTRLEPIRNILIDKGYKVTVLIADFDHIRKRTISVKYAECTYLPVPQYKSNISLQRIYSHLTFGKAVKKQLSTQQPDLVYVLVPPNNIAKYCAAYKNSHTHTKLILDIIDLWPESFPYGSNIKNIFPFTIWKNWRSTCIKVADYVFTECDLYQEKLKGILPKSKTSTLHLFKEQTETERKLVLDVIHKKETDTKTVKFAYLGSMNNILDTEGITNVIKAFLAQGYNTELHAIGKGESEERFKTAVEQTGCKTFFHGPIFDECAKIKILAPCDYAFNMMRNTVEVGLTIKSIDYLSYGLPLINNIKGDTWRFVEEQKIGVNINTSEEWKPKVKGIIHKDKIIDFYINHFSGQVFRQNILHVLEKIT